MFCVHIGSAKNVTKLHHFDEEEKNLKLNLKCFGNNVQSNNERSMETYCIEESW